MGKKKSRIFLLFTLVGEFMLRLVSYIKYNYELNVFVFLAEVCTLALFFICWQSWNCVVKRFLVSVNQDIF